MPPMITQNGFKIHAVTIQQQGALQFSLTLRFIAVTAGSLNHFNRFNGFPVRRR